MIFRLDYDEEYGTHLNYVNYEYGKRKPVKILIPVEIKEKEYHKVIKGYNESR